MEREQILHYEEPAKGFFEGLPIGNGRLGGMILGHPMEDRIILNESTVWSGSPQDSDREGAAEYLPQIRELLMEGKNYEAQKLFAQHFTCQGAGTNYANGTTVPFGCYQVLGTLRFFFFQKVSYSRQSCESVRHYSRDLHLAQGRAQVSFGVHGQEFKREYICSAPDQVLAARFTGDASGSLNFIMALDREENFAVRMLPGLIMEMTGTLPDGKGGDGVSYACHVKVRTKGGSIFENSGRLCVKGADEAEIYIAAATNMQGFLGRNLKDEKAASLREVNAACEKGWDAVYETHRKDFSSYYDRNYIVFGRPENHTGEDLKKRLEAFDRDSRDYGLYELYYNYARYLLLSSSRKGGLPCNLQGIWAEEIQTPWNGDWHLNAQQELYWLAEAGNLSECHEPYLRLTEKLVEPGKKTAKTYYGMNGWLAHTCTNPWGFTSPCESADWGSTTGSAAWQAHHMWEHYLYTCDREYLEWAYPVMKEAALFYLDMLVEEPEHGWLVTSPSSSPENQFLDEQGRPVSLCMGPAYDQELVKNLFEACIQAAQILGIEEELAEKLREKSARLAPVRIASDGRIMEWIKEYPEALVHHRHLSHLWGVYPGDQISYEKTPELAEATEKSLKQRGLTTAGWANAYRMCVWARLRNGKKAYESLQTAFLAATSYNLLNLAFHCDEKASEPEWPDIEHNYYPFQMDGNEGHAAGIALMVMDDAVEVGADNRMNTSIYLLPALPEELAEGEVRGMCARGGFRVSFCWRDGKVCSGSLENLYGNRAQVLCGGVKLAFSDKKGESVSFSC